MLPMGVDIIVFTDSATSADALADHTAHAPLMQFLLLQLVQNVHFRRVVGRAFVQHGYGETNVIADGKSRGYDDVVESIARGDAWRALPRVTPAAGWRRSPQQAVAPPQRSAAPRVR